MDVKDILVFLEAPRTHQALLGVATAWAARDQATLTAQCLCGEPTPEISESFVIGPNGVGEVIAHREAAISEAASATLGSFQAAVHGAGIAGQWRPPATSAFLEDQAHAARLCDIAMLSKPGGPGTDSRRLAELVVLGGGVPTLLVPDEARRTADFGHVMVAWDGSREATRALADALPVLARAAQTTIVIVGGEAEGEGVLSHLQRHRIAGDIVEADAGRHGPGETLLRLCAERAADLLVMGAYGRSRAAEMILGGATRTILAEAALPVLLSH